MTLDCKVVVQDEVMIQLHAVMRTFLLGLHLVGREFGEHILDLVNWRGHEPNDGLKWRLVRSGWVRAE